MQGSRADLSRQTEKGEQGTSLFPGQTEAQEVPPDLFGRHADGELVTDDGFQLHGEPRAADFRFKDLARFTRRVGEFGGGEDEVTGHVILLKRGYTCLFRTINLRLMGKGSALWAAPVLDRHGVQEDPLPFSSWLDVGPTNFGERSTRIAPVVVYLPAPLRPIRKIPSFGALPRISWVAQFAFRWP